MHPLEPAESPTLSTGRKVGHHRIQGISDEFIPAIVKLDELDEVIAVHDGDAILMAQKLAHHGLAVGISSGANLVGALKVQAMIGGDAPVVTIFCDSNKKYLSTDLLRREPVRPEYESPHVEILGYAAFSRNARFAHGERSHRHTRIARKMSATIRAASSGPAPPVRPGSGHPEQRRGTRNGATPIVVMTAIMSARVFRQRSSPRDGENFPASHRTRAHFRPLLARNALSRLRPSHLARPGVARRS